MRAILKSAVYFFIFLMIFSCSELPKEKSPVTASEILGNPDYLAISYGGYRENTREIVPSIDQIKEDMESAAKSKRESRQFKNSQFSRRPERG